jgi:hypothetical protein
VAGVFLQALLLLLLFLQAPLLLLPLLLLLLPPPLLLAAAASPSGAGSHGLTALGLASAQQATVGCRMLVQA